MKIFCSKKIILFIFASITLRIPAQVLDIDSALKTVYENNSELISLKSIADSENAMISSKSSLDNPRIGLMQEKNMSPALTDMGTMKFWSVSQEINFPAKYFVRGSIQSSRAKTAYDNYLSRKWEVRQNTLTNLFGYYTGQKILGLLEAQKITLHEIARIVEGRRSSGSVTQQDEMRAHVEQTKLENELLLQQQEIAEFQAKLNLNLNRSSEESVLLNEIKRPKLKIPLHDLQKLDSNNSNIISGAISSLDEMKKEKILAGLNYFPDFNFSYKKLYGNKLTPDGQSIGVEMTIPLWFLTKESSDYLAASFRRMAAEKKLEQTKREVDSETYSLGKKVETIGKLLNIFETSLIPQLTTTLRASQTAYSAGRVGFQDLLDAERSLYSMQIDYYRNIYKWVESIVILEKTVGMTVSDLPAIGENNEK